jgi:Phage integrase, N-terminal SAM-like domain
MGEVEVAAFLTHLAADRHVAASTQNQALSARLFFMSSFSSASWAFSTT